MSDIQEMLDDVSGNEELKTKIITMFDGCDKEAIVDILKKAIMNALKDMTAMSVNNSLDIMNI